MLAKLKESLVNHKNQNLIQRFIEHINSKVSALSEHRGPEPRCKPKFVQKIDESEKSDIAYKIYTILSQLLKKRVHLSLFKGQFMLETVLKIW